MGKGNADCVHEQAAKADFECPLYSEKYALKQFSPKHGSTRSDAAVVSPLPRVASMTAAASTVAAPAHQAAT